MHFIYYFIYHFAKKRYVETLNVFFKYLFVLEAKQNKDLFVFKVQQNKQIFVLTNNLKNLHDLIV